MTEKISPLDAQIQLFGPVNDAMFASFTEQLKKARASDHDRPIVLSLNTNGGDADTGRRIAEDIRLCRELDGRRMVFVGIATVYSAGITIMAAFPREERYLSKGARLLIHERRDQKTVELQGALRAATSILRDELAAVEDGQALERQGFEKLVAGTPLVLQEVMDKVMTADWYLGAEEAVRVGLVQAVI